MFHYAANLSFLFEDAPFLERFERAAASRFSGVEYLFPYPYAAKEIVTRLKANGLIQVLFNAPAGDWSAGERGYGAIPGREKEFRSSIDQALRYAEMLEVGQIHVMAGIAPSESLTARTTYLRNLEYAASRFAASRLVLLIEPINPRDMPGYFLRDFGEAMTIIDELDADNVRLQFDIYHRQLIHGDVTVGLQRAKRYIGHIQIASVPDRQEPDRGELSLPHILGVLDQLPYEGWVGCEYRPCRRTEEGLYWRDTSRREL